MDKRIIVTAVCSMLGLINASGFARAETVGRYECSVVGAVSQEPIGDKDGHRITGVQYSCSGVEGPVKGAVYTGSSTSEWDGPQGTYLSGGGTVRAAGGLAVTQITEGKGSAVMKDGKPAGSESSGKRCTSSLPARWQRCRERWSDGKPNQWALVYLASN